MGPYISLLQQNQKKKKNLCMTARKLTRNQLRIHGCYNNDPWLSSVPIELVMEWKGQGAKDTNTYSSIGSYKRC